MNNYISRYYSEPSSGKFCLHPNHDVHLCIAVAAVNEVRLTSGASQK